jgi:hypothetical protein
MISDRDEQYKYTLAYGPSTKYDYRGENTLEIESQNDAPTCKQLSLPLPLSLSPPSLIPSPHFFLCLSLFISLSFLLYPISSTQNKYIPIPICTHTLFIHFTGSLLHSILHPVSHSQYTKPTTNCHWTHAHLPCMYQQPFSASQPIYTATKYKLDTEAKGSTGFRILKTVL